MPLSRAIDQADINVADTLASLAIAQLAIDIRSRIAADIRSDAAYGLVKAARDFRPDKYPDIPFAAYSIIRIRGAIGDGMREMGLSIRQRKAEQFSGLFTEAEEKLSPEEQNPIRYDDDVNDVEDLIERLHSDAAMADWRAWAKINLTNREVEVCNELSAGKTQREASDAMGITESRISQLLKAIRNKIRKTQFSFQR